MYNVISTKITRKLLKHNLIDEKKQNIYSYGFEVLVSYFSYLAIAIIIAFATKTFIPSMIFVFSFSILRKYAGGAHANSYKLCHMLFSINHVAFVLFIKNFPVKYINVFTICILSLMLLVVWLLAPIDHEHRRFNKAEQRFFKHTSRMYMLLISLLLYIISKETACTEFVLSYLFGSFSATISLIFGWVKNRKRLV
ncbi:MAG: accessory gene regulator B family protein [Clostridia bacterium]|nr:accessory gene regulator B family protein [Clostridia bacterium]